MQVIIACANTIQYFFFTFFANHHTHRPHRTHPFTKKMLFFTTLSVQERPRGRQPPFGPPKGFAGKLLKNNRDSLQNRPEEACGPRTARVPPRFRGHRHPLVDFAENPHGILNISKGRKRDTIFYFR